MSALQHKFLPLKTTDTLYQDDNILPVPAGVQMNHWSLKDWSEEKNEGQKEHKLSACHRSQKFEAGPMR